MYDIITIGDIKLDTFIVIPEATGTCTLKKGKEKCLFCFEYGKKIPVESFEPQIAGSAANVAVGCSRLGLRTAIVSVMGDDETADMAFMHLGKEGVDTRFIETKKNTPSSFSIVLTYKGERTILAKHEPHPYRLPKNDGAAWYYLSELGHGYEELFKKIPEFIKKNNIKLAFNPGAIQIEGGLRVLAPILKVTEVLIVNLEEAHQILGKKNGLDLNHLIKSLWKLGPNIVVISDGARGAFAFDGGDIVHHPAFPAKVLEATGAGDSLGTGIVAALAKGKSAMEALSWGMANAASVIAHVGPQPGLLTEAGIARTLKKHATVKAHIQ